jgi:hypothetical protein
MQFLTRKARSLMVRALLFFRCEMTSILVLPLNVVVLPVVVVVVVRLFAP